MMSIQTKSMQEFITTKIIIMVTTQPVKKVPITNKTEQPMKMEPAPTQPMNTAQTIPKRLQ